MITGVQIVLLIRHVNVKHRLAATRVRCLAAELPIEYTLRSIIVSGLDGKSETTMTAVCGHRREMYGPHQYEVLPPGSLEMLAEISVNGRTLAAILDRRPRSLDGCLRAHR